MSARRRRPSRAACAAAALVAGAIAAGASRLRAAEPAETPVREFVRSTGWLLVFAAIIGVALVAFAFWLLWRKGAKKHEAADAHGAMARRIAHAASGFPTTAEIAAWPAARLRGGVVALAELEGFSVRPWAGADADFALHRAGENPPAVLVRCAAGESATLSARRVRELHDALARANVRAGWLAANGGFSAEARTVAGGLVLIDPERLLAMLHDVPPLHLPRVLARDE